MNSNETTNPLCRTEAELEEYDELSWWFEGLFQILICSIGILANGISIPVLLSREMANVFNRTLACLAVFDNLYLLMSLLESIRIFHKDLTTDVHIILFPTVLFPLYNIAFVASIYTTLVVSLERYFAVSKPLSVFATSADGKWRPILFYVLPVIIFSVLFNAPKFMEFKIDFVNRTLNDDDKETVLTLQPILEPTQLRYNKYYISYYINVIRILGTGIVPLISLVLLNSLVYKNLVERRKNINTMFDSMDCQTVNHHMKVENRQAHTLFGVVILFILGNSIRIFLNIHEYLMSITSSPMDEDQIGLFDFQNSTELLFDDEQVENSTLASIRSSTIPRNCVMWPFSIMVLKSLSGVFMAVSQASNLIIYCLANALFRRVMLHKLKKPFNKIWKRSR